MILSPGSSRLRGVLQPVPPWPTRTTINAHDPFQSVSANSRHRLSKPVVIVQAGSDASILDYIEAGPLMEECVPLMNVRESHEQWEELGEVVIESLGYSKGKMDPAAKMRVYQYYLPVFFWCWEQVKAHKAAGKTQPLVIGMQAVQGCGKTTLVEELQTLFKHVGLRAASVSIDDFYLTFQGQQQLIKDNPGNFLLGVRGNALTHDLDLGQQTLEKLVAQGQNAQPGASTQVPRYNKSAHEGRGDRASSDDWPTVEGPIDVVLFEGWMLGFRPVAEEVAEKISKDLVPINKKLKEYKEKWDKFVDAWLVIKVSDPAFVFRWRQQAETSMRKAGKGAMTDDQVKDFVNRYMPAYKAYLPVMYKDGPTTGHKGNVLMFEIDESRGLVNAENPSA